MANFDVEAPAPRSTVTVGSSHLISVRINDFTASDRNFTARIFEITGGAIGSEISNGLLGAKDTAGKRSVMLDVGDPSTALATPYNRAVRVEDGTDLEEEGHRFRIVPEGSGSGSGQEKLPEQVLAKVCRSDQPIPTILTLKLDGTLAKGSCSNTGELNRPVTLRFSMVEPFVGRWLSKPIALGEKKPGPPAFWVLEKKNAKTWTLTLRQQNKKIAVYVCKTKEAKDCSMPIQLKLKGAKGKHFKKWPRLAKVKPAKAAQ